MELESNFMSCQNELDYEIHSYSSYEEPFFPCNIKYECPFNGESRWTSSSNNLNEYIILKLNVPSILTTITFGKFKKPHNGNVKSFNLYIAQNKNDFTKVLSAILKNDNEPQTFEIDYKDKTPFPCCFVKIKPITLWGTDKFNFTLWFLKLIGVKDQKIVNYYEKYHLEKNKEIAIENYRSLLLENHGFNAIEAFQKMGVFKSQPHNVLEKLYDFIVVKEDYEETLNLLHDLYEKCVFDEYVSELPYSYKWTYLQNEETSRNEINFKQWEENFMFQEKNNPNNIFSKFLQRFKTKKNLPKQRGGHQMCIDEEEGKIYLFGGFYGKKDWDMLDFWCFNISQRKWTQILPTNPEDSWPDPRCCHCLSFDPLEKKIYVLGGLVSRTELAQASSKMENDFYVFDLKENKWKILSLNTENEDGPFPISSGQMCIDPVEKILYVFGGRTGIKEDIFQANFSVFYAYDIKSNKWNVLDLKKNNSQNVFEDFTAIYENECYGHCMVFNPIKKEIAIFGGIVKNNLISDFFTISTKDCIIKRVLFPNITLPNIAFHKGCYNPKTNSFFFYSGYFKNIHGVFQANYLFECNIAKNKFRNIYQDFNIDRNYWYEQSFVEKKAPHPRFSHQFLYNSIEDEFYLFGGNPNQPFSVLKKRLNDMWLLKVFPPRKDFVLKKIKFLVKKLQFLSKVKNTPMNKYNNDHFGKIQVEFQEIQKMSLDENEQKEMRKILQGAFLWGSEEIEKEKIETFKFIKNMCHCEKVKKRKFFLAYMDY